MRDSRSLSFVSRLKEDPIVATALAKFVIQHSLDTCALPKLSNTDSFEDEDRDIDIRSDLIEIIGGFARYAQDELWKDLIPQALAFCFAKFDSTQTSNNHVKYDELALFAADAITTISCADTLPANLAKYIVEPFTTKIMPLLKSETVDTTLFPSIADLVMLCCYNSPELMLPHCNLLSKQAMDYLALVPGNTSRHNAVVSILLSTVCNKPIVTLLEIREIFSNHDSYMDTIVALSHCATRFPLEYSSKLITLVQNSIPLSERDYKVDLYIFQRALCQIIKMQPEFVSEYPTISWVKYMLPLQSPCNVQHRSMWNTCLAFENVKRRTTLTRWQEMINPKTQAILNYYARCLSLFSAMPASKQLSDVLFTFKSK